MAIQTSTSQTIVLEGDVVVTLDRWTGGVTVRSGEDSVTLRGNKESLEIAVRSYISGARYVQEEDAAAISDYLSTLIETATASIRALQDRYPSLLEADSVA